MKKTEIAIAITCVIAIAIFFGRLKPMQGFTCRNHGEIKHVVWVDDNPLCKDCILEIVPVVIERETHDE